MRFRGVLGMATSRARWWLGALAVPVVATAVYCNQLYQHATAELTLWKGGGMGMFAGLDSPNMRFVRVYVTERDGERLPVQAFSFREQRLIEQLKSQPNDETFRRLAASVRSSDWYISRWSVEARRVSNEGELSPGPTLQTVRRHDALDDTQDTEPLDVAGVQIEYWRIRYDGQTSEFYATLERSLDDSD